MKELLLLIGCCIAFGLGLLVKWLFKNKKGSWDDVYFENVIRNNNNAYFVYDFKFNFCEEDS